jgi:TonB family protein
MPARSKITAYVENRMTRSLADVACLGVLCGVVALWGTAIPVGAQGMPEIDNIASRAAERVAKTRARRVFVFGHLSCQLDMELCTAFDVSLRDNLEKLAPGVQFLKREDIISLLPKHGLIALDVDVRDVLVPVASEAGAEVMVTYTLQWKRDGSELSSEIIDAVKQKKLDQFETKIVRPGSDVHGMPLLIKDQESGITSVIYRGTPAGPTASWYPHCDKCPDPTYTPAARGDNMEGRVVLLATISEQGTAEQISVIKSLKDGLTDSALEAVRNWRFRPAIGTDGKPFKTRVPIEVTFRLHP